MENYLIPECHYEQEVLFILGYSKKEINKVSGCNGVITEIQKAYKQKMAIGWIDQDPMKQSSRHPDYRRYNEIDSKFKVHLKRKPGTMHFLIEIEDEFEFWFEPLGKKVGISKEDYKISNHLHEYSKILIPNNVKRYLNQVVIMNRPPFDYLKELIQNIREGKY